MPPGHPIDVYRAVMRPIHARALTVEADREALARLRELDRRHALVFLPTHRSSVDPLVLRDLLHDFPSDHLVVDDDVAVWPLRPTGRRTGVVFLRRGFGRRVQTGTPGPPRLALLRHLSAAVEAGGDDVLLVPTSIVHDRLAPSGAAGLRWMAAHIRAQQHPVGVARVTFAEPFSLSDALAAAGPGPARLEKVAFRVCDAINRVAPVANTSLVSLALMGVRQHALTLEQVARAAEPLLDHLEHRGALGQLDQLREPAAMRLALDGLVEAGVASMYDGGTEPVWAIAPRGHEDAALHRNGAVHHFVTRAIVELALPRAAQAPAGEPLDAILAEALALRDLLKFEFVFADRARFRDEVRFELELLDPDWRARVSSPIEALSMLADTGLLVAGRCLQAFVEAQSVVAERLAAADPCASIDRARLLGECHGVGRQLVLQGRLQHPESASRELFASALDLAAKRGLLTTGRERLRAARREWLEEVEDVRARLRVIEGLNISAFEDVLDDIAA